MSKPIVTNAADEKQNKRARHKARLIRNRELDDIKEVCSTLQGRRFLWRMLAECKTFGSIWEPSARIHYNAGKQDIGHFLMSEIISADEKIYMQMMLEAKAESEQ